MLRLRAVEVRGTWQMPWNPRSDARDRTQVGCIYTVQASSSTTSVVSSAATCAGIAVKQDGIAARARPATPS
jgi:hypothetical protein